MNQMRHRNISYATVAGVHDLLSSGVMLEVRGQHARELRNRVTVLERPRERCLFVPHRGNEIIATVAETLWVLAGRNDIGWLRAYLPRASDFSDDGITWRGGYGPRLRRWYGADQLAECRRLLTDEHSTRRAVMSLYDPACDFVESKDIPCNNWLHWLIRDGKLHLTVGVRSNDIVWGFSGVNSFEWSVLQEMMASWVGADIGDITYLATSFHLYERHERRARRMVENFGGITCYDFGLIAPAFSTPFDKFDGVLSAWFDLEARVRDDPEHMPSTDRLLGDAFFSLALNISRFRHGVARGWRDQRVKEELARLPACDLTAATYEFYSRRFPAVLEAIPDPRIAAFFAAYNRGNMMSTGDVTTLILAIKDLHTRKDAAYGPSWKKRGELTSILCNVARKVDRLEQYTATGVTIGEESVFETAIDLFVYLIKYRLFLLDRMPDGTDTALSKGLRPFSDNVHAFNLSTDQYISHRMPTEPTDMILSEIVTKFEQIHAIVAKGTASDTERLAGVKGLADLVFGLIGALSDKDPHLIQKIEQSYNVPVQPAS